MKRLYVALACAMGAAVLVAATGCGDDDKPAKADTTGTQQQAAKPAKVAYLLSALDPFSAAQNVAFKEAVTAGGGSMKLFVANFDPQKQFAQCKDAISSGRYNVIVLSVFDPATGVPCVEAAKAANIPVVAANTPVGTDANVLEPQVDGVVGGAYLPPDTNAKESVELVKAACEGLNPCKIIAEIATPTDPVTNFVVEQATKQVPNAQILQKFATQFDPSQIAKVIPDVLSAHPDAQVYLSIADSQALAALPAIKAAGLDGKLKIIGSGGSREGAKAVADGILFGSTGSWPAQQGTLFGEMAIKAANGQPIDPIGVDALTMDEPQILTKANIDQFTPEWGVG